MNKKFFAFFTILSIFFSTSAMARDPEVSPADKMRTHWWWQTQYDFPTPNEPVTMPCRKPTRLGLNVWSGLNVQSNMSLFPSKTIGADLEFCVTRYSNVNWAPMRAAFEIFMGTNQLNQQKFSHFSAGIRYQTPMREKIDFGFYWRYKYSTNLVEVQEDHHTIIFGLLGEFRPGYSATEVQTSSHFYLSTRFGVGADQYGKAKKTDFITEFLLGAGYRFADF